jgi:hypothetical protein
MKRQASIVFFLFLLCIPSLAMKNHKTTFREPCDAVWHAAVTVAKSQNYRIVSIATDEHVISLVAGGVWWGERIISASLAPGVEFGCELTVQSRYSGAEHSDGPDFIARVTVELITPNLNHNSVEYHKFEDCLHGGSDWGGSRKKVEEKCETQLRATLEAEKAVK